MHAFFQILMNAAKRTNAMQIPLLLVRMAHKIALVTLISGDGFNCEGASDIRP